MYEISEYALFYLKLEGIGNHEELMSIDVKEESFQMEKSRSKDLVEVLVELFKTVDKDLQSIEGYKCGTGEYGIKMQHFGPVLLAYTKIINKESVKSVYSLMALRLPRILRKMGVNGRFARGAFVKGFGWEIEEGDCRTLYGPVMDKAWHYLTVQAYSLRIIIEPEIFKVVSDRASYGEGKDGDWLPLYAYPDYDGQGVFHYLAYDPTCPSVLHDTIEVVVAEMKQTLKTIQQVTTNLASVYYKHDNSQSIRMSVALRDYVSKSISKWTGQKDIDILREVDPDIDAMFRSQFGSVSRKELSSGTNDR
jgi:hypothetical protein